MNKVKTLLAFVLLSSLTVLHAAIGADASASLAPDVAGLMEAYNLKWASIAKDEGDNVPLGNGNTGINLWAEPNGDLVFYVARNDAVSEMERVLKLARIRVNVSPNPFASGKPYQQTLNICKGYCDIHAGEKDKAVRLRVLVDSDAQTVYVSGASDQPITVTATVDNWRKEPNDVLLRGQGSSTHLGNAMDKTAPRTESADVFVRQPAAIMWYHRNEGTFVPFLIRSQHLAEFASVVTDPILNRTFGASVSGKGFKVASDTSLAMEKPAREFELRLSTHADQTPTAEAFVAALQKQAAAAVGMEEAQKRTQAYWEKFWNRSWIFIDQGDPSKQPLPKKTPYIYTHTGAPDESDSPSEVTQAYILTRYQLAAQERSGFPAHFNGGIFNVAADVSFCGLTKPIGHNFGADFRCWGSSLWWQNTRFLYQANMAQGNFEFMLPYFDFYFRNAPVFEAKAKVQYNAKGVYMNETLSLCGLPTAVDYGAKAEDYSGRYTRDIWQQCLELSVLVLEYYYYTGDETFLKKAIEWSDKAVTFYDTRFKKDSQGTIIISPTHALESYWIDVTNDMPSVAGLQDITRQLLALPERLTTPEQRTHWKRVAAAVPALPKKKNKEGLLVPAIAESYADKCKNMEAPDLYCVFPFRIYGVGRTEHNIEEARRAWETMPYKKHFCWFQSGIFAARLGLTYGAKEDILLRLEKRAAVMNDTEVKKGTTRFMRFPGYFGSQFDWNPDYDGSGNMINVIQEMLLQPGPNGQILLMPAWPKEWNVKFKLHAYKQTIVEGEYRQGRMVSLKVTPPERAKDVVWPAASLAEKVK